MCVMSEKLVDLDPWWLDDAPESVSDDKSTNCMFEKGFLGSESFLENMVRLCTKIFPPKLNSEVNYILGGKCWDFKGKKGEKNWDIFIKH